MKEFIKNMGIAMAIFSVFVWMIITFTVDHVRSVANMEPISYGYVYDKNSRLVYTENGIFDIEYTIYQDEDGKMNYYIPETSTWVPVD